MFINMFLNINSTLSITGYVQVEIPKVKLEKSANCLRKSDIQQRRSQNEGDSGVKNLTRVKEEACYNTRHCY